MPGAVSVQKGEATAANDDGRLPFTDKGTRVVVFGATAQQAKVVAAEIAKKAYWNSSYFGGTFEDVSAAGLVNHRPSVAARNASLAADAACLASPTAADIDNGSFDPDGGALTLAVVPAGPFGLGQHQVALVGTDQHGASAASAAFITVSDRTAPAIGDVAFSWERQPSPRHGMTLLTLDYVTADNCGGVATALTVSGGRDAERARVVDAHHVLLKNGHDGGSDDDEQSQVSVTILVTDEAGNQSARTVTIGGRSKER